ncbi:hypothetical protein Bealeia1_01893 [Candidatus Bealeia paramacronuclearis]|uniref:Glycosyltransferase n=1 Tax=Candidatus Bealeia paramacronuclearis TaxID=1921001 RepID=A0ABZ2C5C6_9PROT|nr:hypothetical protein [Candidatus Bealeia paramacronuclearis]
MSEVVNVVCMKWGEKYPSEYVNVLKGMVKRNLSLPHRFVCLTDEPEGLRPDIEVFPMPAITVPESYDVSPWRKLGMFSQKLGDLKGKTLFLDLDIVIVDSIDDFFTYSPKFSIIENWTQAGQGIGNSSVYCFEIGAHKDVLETYTHEMDSVLKAYHNEQIFLSKKIGDIDFWPEAWCQSFKRHCIPGGLMRYFKAPVLPMGCKIVVFHGLPNPPEAIHGGFFGSLRKYTRPAPWVGKYWRE